MPEVDLQTNSIPLRILLVEDDPDLRSTLSQALQEEGYEVEAVASGTEAIEASTRRTFDLVVTDIKLPGTDGLSALETVKAENPGIAGIVITGYSTEEDAVRAARLRVENYLTKPFHIDEFLSAVDRLSENKRRAELKRARQLGYQKGLHWLSRELLLAQKACDPELLDRGLLHARSGPLAEGREACEKLALETAFLWRVLENAGLSIPIALWQSLPESLSSSLLVESELTKWLQKLTANLIDHGEFDDVEERDQLETETSLQGSILNVALLLESSGRSEEAARAFSEALKGGDPNHLYRANFGLARLARQHREHRAMERYLEDGVKAATSLGPLAACEALTERGLLLSLAKHPQGKEALRAAQEAAKSVKDTVCFSLSRLASAHFHGEALAQRSRMLAHLHQPEHFPAALEASGWLLEYLLKEDNDEAGQRFLQKLLRSAPKSFQLLISNTHNPTLAERALEYLHLASPSTQAVALQRFATLDSPELLRKLSQWRTQTDTQNSQRRLLRIFSFSGMQLYLDDETIDMKRKKPLLLLLYLLVRNSPVGEEGLLEQFWPGDEGRARSSLRSALYYLRKLIAPEVQHDPFERSAAGITLSKELNIWFDYREFTTLIHQGETHKQSHPLRAVEAFRLACKLYRGPFLENVYEDWSLEVREQAQVAMSGALRYLTEQCLATNSWAEAHEHACRALRHDDLNQPFYEMAMRALLELDRHHEALQLFEQGKACLERDLGLEPSIEMIRLRETARLNV